MKYGKFKENQNIHDNEYRQRFFKKNCIAVEKLLTICKTQPLQATYG